MPINPDAVGATSDPVEVSWTSKDALLYAVGIGADARSAALLQIDRAAQKVVGFNAEVEVDETAEAAAAPAGAGR